MWLAVAALAVLSAVAGGVSTTLTDCDACLTTAEEYYQTWVESAQEHFKHRRLRERSGKDAGGQTWWDHTTSALYGNGVTFEERMLKTCDTDRLALYKPGVRAMCERLLHPSGDHLNQDLVPLYGGRPDVYDPTAWTPGDRMGVGRVPGIKWYLCHNVAGHCLADVHFKSKMLLTDRCGMCLMLAKDLLFLVRRGEPGRSPRDFYSASVADMCLSIDLRHPRGQHTRLTEICHDMLDSSEGDLVDLLLSHVRLGAGTSDDQFANEMCSGLIGLC